MKEQKHITNKYANKIIIKLPNFIGDSIMSTSAIQLLLQEYPKAKLTIICRKHTEDLFINHPSVNQIIIDHSKNVSNRLFYTLSLIKQIRKEKYDLGILFQNNFANALIFKLSRIKTIIGYENYFRSIFLNYHIKIDKTQHYINRYARLVNSFFLDKYTQLPKLKIWNKPSPTLFHFGNNKQTIVLNLGNNTQQYRAYPLELSLSLIKILISSKEFNLILVGDEHDAIRANQYNIKHSTSLINLTNKTSISNYIGIIDQSDLLVTIDSSAMHIAAVVNTPFITLLGKSTSVFSTVKPKVNFGIYLKNENGLIDENQFISHISTEMITNHIRHLLKEKLNSKLRVKKS